MRKLLLYLAALLSFCPVLVQAETIAATSTPGTADPANLVGWNWTHGLAPGVNFSSHTAGCADLASRLSGTVMSLVAEGANYKCGVDRPPGFSDYYGYISKGGTCYTGYTLTGGTCVPPSTYSCPVGQNWTLSGTNCTRPDCVSPQVRNGATGVCELPPCLATTQVQSERYYDVGVDPNNVPKFICSGGCMALYSGASVSHSAIVEGVRHYYMLGSYSFTGSGSVDQCTAGAQVPAPPSGVTEIPVSHCASNQIEGLIDGKLNCWNVPAVAGEAPTLANPDAAATTTGTSSTTVTTVGDVTTTTTTTTNNNGGTTIWTQACTGANCTTTTETTGADQTDDPDATNPGTGAATTGLYTADTGGKTFSGVLTSFKNTVSASPIASAAGGFFQAGTFSGNCAALDVSFTMLGHAFALDATDVFCGTTAQTWYGYIAAGLLLIATALAFWIAIL